MSNDQVRCCSDQMGTAADSVEQNFRAALARLIMIAKGDTGQSRRVANFLLALWNVEECGGFNLTELWGLDAPVAVDMVTVFAVLPACQYYPDTLGYCKDFEGIVRGWRSAG